MMPLSLNRIYCISFKVILKLLISKETLNVLKRECGLQMYFVLSILNQFVRGEIKDEIVKRVIVNGQTGSSWYFKRFNRINIIVAPLLNELKIITG